MITPQKELYNISCSVNRLQEMLCLEHEDYLFTRIEHIYEEMQKMDRMQDQLDLIIKLLGKNE